MHFNAKKLHSPEACGLQTIHDEKQSRSAGLITLIVQKQQSTAPNVHNVAHSLTCRVQANLKICCSRNNFVFEATNKRNNEIWVQCWKCLDLKDWIFHAAQGKTTFESYLTTINQVLSIISSKKNYIPFQVQPLKFHNISRCKAVLWLLFIGFALSRKSMPIHFG